VVVRRPLPWILFLAVMLHGLGIARTLLPAQDGLKYIRVARDFGHQPFLDVIRGSDQHPLYSFLVAVLHGTIEPFIGNGAVGWRVAAQSTALIATLFLLIALYDWTKHFESRRTAAWACLIWLALPIPSRLGHDTLGDGIAWAAILITLTASVRWLDSGSRRAAIVCGIASGVGYLARPEVALAPVALAIVAGLKTIRRRQAFKPIYIAQTWAVFLAIVGFYALAKGEISEKLSLRLATGIGPSAAVRSQSVVQPTLEALRGPEWDFTPKEETERPIEGGIPGAVGRLVQATGEGLGWLGGALAIAGIVLGRSRAGSAGLIGAVFAVGFAAVLIRHETAFGYLSERHAMPLVLLCLPRVAMGLRMSILRLASWRGWPARGRRLARLAVVLCFIALGFSLQAKPAHPSRWGHWAAGQWLKEHANVNESVLDTRGWAAFVSELRAYDYWHVRQALTDSSLSYVVVTQAELEAPSRRAASLRALLAQTATIAAAFPERIGGHDTAIRIYRFQRPAAWEARRP
jgi:Dolichyl-phosphate-mannose-protein mannosyltransferase